MGRSRAAGISGIGYRLCEIDPAQKILVRFRNGIQQLVRPHVLDIRLHQGRMLLDLPDGDLFRGDGLLDQSLLLRCEWHGRLVLLLRLDCRRT